MIDYIDMLENYTEEILLDTMSKGHKVNVGFDSFCFVLCRGIAMHPSSRLHVNLRTSSLTGTHSHDPS